MYSVTNILLMIRGICNILEYTKYEFRDNCGKVKIFSNETNIQSTVIICNCLFEENCTLAFLTRI